MQLLIASTLINLTGADSVWQNTSMDKSVTASADAVVNLNPVGSKNLLKNSEAESGDQSVAVARNPHDRTGVETYWRDGWQCKTRMYCLKKAGLELIRYNHQRGYPAIGNGWTIEKCQLKCEEYGKGCVMVDMWTFYEKASTTLYDFDNDQSACVLYTWENSLLWDKHADKEDACHHDSMNKAMTCAHNGKGPDGESQSDSPVVQAPTVSKNLLTNSQAKSADKSVTAAADAVVESDSPAVQGPNPTGSKNLLKNSQAESADKSVTALTPDRDGWKCKLGMYCLKEEGLELFRYDEPAGKSWTVARCQKMCEDYNRRTHKDCVRVDIKTYSKNVVNRGPFDYNQSTCVLYTRKNALNWDTNVPEPEGCHHKSLWMTCAWKQPCATRDVKTQCGQDSDGCKVKIGKGFGWPNKCVPV